MVLLSILQKKKILQYDEKNKTVKHICCPPEYTIIFYDLDGNTWEFNTYNSYTTEENGSNNNNYMNLDLNSSKQLDTFLLEKYKSNSYVQPSNTSFATVMQQSKLNLDVKPYTNTFYFHDGNHTQKIENASCCFYEGYQYFQLTDIAKILGYQIYWDDYQKYITLHRDENYQDIKNLSKIETPTSSYPFTHQRIIIKEQPYDKVFFDVNCINVNGISYFKLRDLQPMMHFVCQWDNQTHALTLVRKDPPKDAYTIPENIKSKI